MEMIVIFACVELPVIIKDMKVNSVLVIFNILGIIGSLIWLMTNSSWESIVTTIGLIGSLIALLYSKANNNSRITMKQKSGKNSRNYQSGRDINIK